MRRWLVGLVLSLVLACRVNPPTPQRVFIDTPSQRLFDSSVTESRRIGLEIAGCFNVLQAKRVLVFYGATVSDSARQPSSVYIVCSGNQAGRWHTHWDGGLDPCNPSPIDVGCLGEHQIGIVVCGVGRDSLRGFVSDTSYICPL